MKKVTYTIGLLTSVAISMGWLFTVLHWPGGKEMFNYGFLGFTLGFSTLMGILHIGTLKANSALGKLKFITGLSGAWLSGLSLVFKLLHFTGASTLLITGFILFSLGFLPLFFFGLYKKDKRN